MSYDLIGGVGWFYEGFLERYELNILPYMVVMIKYWAKDKNHVNTSGLMPLPWLVKNIY